MQTLRIAGVVVVLGASQVLAQALKPAASDGGAMFSIPSATGLHCERNVVPAEQQAVMGATMYRFIAGTRVMMPSYDTAGNVRSIIDMKPGVDSAGHDGTEFRSMQFAPPLEFGGRTFLPRDSALRAAEVNSARPPLPLTPAEKEQARALAVWLWSHRCQ